MENPSSRTQKRLPKSAPSAALRLTAGKKKGAEVRVTFGDVTVYGPAPDPEQVRHNIETSHEALGRALTGLIKPGFRLRAKRDVPLYHVDENNPRRFIRRLNGKTESGILENGEFKVIE